MPTKPRSVRASSPRLTYRNSPFFFPTLLLFLLMSGTILFLVNQNAKLNSQLKILTTNIDNSPLSITPTPHLTSLNGFDLTRWKTYSDSEISFMYPPIADVGNYDGLPVLTHWGPTQKEGTEFYDGISFSFFPRQIRYKTLEEHMLDEIDEELQNDTIMIIDPPSPVTIGDLTGFSYTYQGFNNNHKTYYLTSKDSPENFVIVTDSTLDPTNQGFAKIAETILLTLRIK